MIRPAVAWFAAEMERKLQSNDHKPAWDEGDDDEYFFRRLIEEVIELHQACIKVQVGVWAAEDIVLEAADVANFAMMIADRANGSFANRGKAAR